jgi:hypothetical protein
MDPACAGLGVDVEPPAPPAADDPQAVPTVSFVGCGRIGKFLALQLWTWDAFRWNGFEGPVVAWSKNPDKTVIAGTLPLYPENGVTQVMRYILVPAGGEKKKRQSKVVLTHSEARLPSWNLSVSLGPTWSTYTETATALPDVKVSQVGLTAKVQTQFRILPPRWDAAFSVFGTVVPLSHSPDSLPSARWLGINVRGGYQLPLDRLSRNTLSILPGVYAWSMFVPNDQYGLQNLDGPQLVLAYNRAQGAKLGNFATLLRYGGYIKVAVIGSGFGLTGLSNHEFAAGAQLTLRFFSLPKPLVLATDYSSLRFVTEGFAMNLSTISLSLGTSLF